MNTQLVTDGMARYAERINACRQVYEELLAYIGEDVQQTIVKITDRTLFEKSIRTFVTALDPEKAEGDLMNIYDVALHTKTGALIIANKGATLFALSSRTETPHIVRHIGLCVYMPGLGMEYANVGIAGDVYRNRFVLRTESACTPSFIFGSQRCNCHYQWQNVRELAASFNPINVPDITAGDEFEKWVQQQYHYEDGKHVPRSQSGLGFVMLHIDSQNGMGSGYTEGEFVFDLSERASMRHRGEYTAEQVYGATMYGGFTTIGIEGDPRGQHDAVGYKVTPVILDFLGVNKQVIMLTNNPLKMQQMEHFGYELTRVKTIGAVNVAGAVEALERGTEFNHLDIDNSLTSFTEDYDRVREEIARITEGVAQ